jgi:hypothetical protein
LSLMSRLNMSEELIKRRTCFFNASPIRCIQHEIQRGIMSMTKLLNMTLSSNSVFNSGPIFQYT